MKCIVGKVMIDVYKGNIMLVILLKKIFFEVSRVYNVKFYRLKFYFVIIVFLLMLKVDIFSYKYKDKIK